MSGIADMPALSAGMMVSIAAFKAASQMAQQSVALLSAASGADSRAPLPYSSMLDKLA
ncbi:MAG: hypothetical protein LCH38_11685 [Proteobacteria bacterium]|nr:hypothetical protein [Pseudomonadota bacterium]